MDDLTQRPDWLHLKRYGYAPGGYMSRCMICLQTVADLDKRACCCRPCAEKKYATELDHLTAERDALRAEVEGLRVAITESLRMAGNWPEGARAVLEDVMEGRG